MANESINLNLIPTGDMPVIHVSQFDNGRAFNVNLFKGSDEYTIPEGYTAELHCRKADRNIVTLATTNVSSNTLTFTTTTQLCACAGDNLCEVAIKDTEDYLVGSLNFILQVEKDPLQGGIESTSSIHDLTDQIEEITTEIVGENYYTKTETDTLLDSKANAADVYTKTQVDTALSSKANAADVYTKSQVDTALSAKVNTADLATVATSGDYDDLIDKPSLAAVATTGDYDDLTNKPTIPAAQVQSDYAQSDNTKVDYIKNKPDLSIYAKESDLILATGTENEAPYQIRTAPNNIGNLALEKLVGLTVCFNQLVNTGDTSINTVSGHKYYTSINGTKSIIQGGSAVSINDSSEDNVIDLTAMFGSEVADYIYALESGTAGAGVSIFKSLFGADYYPYTANTLMSAKPTGKVIKDENDQTIETIVYSGNELRGLLKVGTNGLYADGDTDDGSGSTDIRYEERAYQSGDESLVNAITDGTNTVVKKATPTTATSTAWSNPIQAKQGGTEEFIDGNVYGAVDLGSLEWVYTDETGHERMRATLSEWKRPANNGTVASGFCEGIEIITANAAYSHRAEGLAKESDTNNIYFYSSDMGTDAAAFKAAMSGHWLIYEKAAEGPAEMPCGHDTIYSKKTNYRYWG